MSIIDNFDKVVGDYLRLQGVEEIKTAANVRDAVLESSIVNVERIELLHFDQAMGDHRMCGGLHFQEIFVISSHNEVGRLDDMLESIHAVAHGVDLADGVGPLSLSVSEAVTNKLKWLMIPILRREERIGINRLMSGDMRSRQLEQVAHEAF